MNRPRSATRAHAPGGYLGPFALATALFLAPAVASAEGTDGAAGAAGGHAVAHDGQHTNEAAAKNGDHDAHGGAGATHAEHFTLMSLVCNAKCQAAIKRSVEGTALERTFVDRLPFAQAGHLTPVFFAIVAFLIVIGLGIAARRRLKHDPDAGVLPARRVGPLLFFEVIVGAVWGLMCGMMDEKVARRHFPLIATLAVFIFVMNVLSLFPTGAPPTDNLNTNIGMSLTVFFAYNWAGIRAHGPIAYFKHFAGPVIYLAPLMVVIEIVSHLVRPVSLALRLMGNMTGDHKVLEIFLGFEIPLLPLPLMVLGLLVCVVQTLVFVLLSTVYLSMATAHEHDEEHAHQAA